MLQLVVTKLPMVRAVFLFVISIKPVKYWHIVHFLVHAVQSAAQHLYRDHNITKHETISIICDRMKATLFVI
jgi:hypothetical protein